MRQFPQWIIAKDDEKNAALVAAVEKLTEDEQTALVEVIDLVMRLADALRQLKQREAAPAAAS